MSLMESPDVVVSARIKLYATRHRQNQDIWSGKELPVDLIERLEKDRIHSNKLEEANSYKFSEPLPEVPVLSMH